MPIGTSTPDHLPWHLVCHYLTLRDIVSLSATSHAYYDCCHQGSALAHADVFWNVSAEHVVRPYSVPPPCPPYVLPTAFPFAAASRMTVYIPTHKSVEVSDGASGVRYHPYEPGMRSALASILCRLPSSHPDLTSLTLCCFRGLHLRAEEVDALCQLRKLHTLAAPMLHMAPPQWCNLIRSHKGMRFLPWSLQLKGEWHASMYDELIDTACQLTQVSNLSFPQPRGRLAQLLDHGMTNQQVVRLGQALDRYSTIKVLRLDGYAGDYSCFAEVGSLLPSLVSLVIGVDYRINAEEHAEGYVEHDSDNEPSRALRKRIPSLRLDNLCFPSLTSLELLSDSVNDAALEALSCSPCAPRLRHLYLNWWPPTRVTDHGLMHLTACTALQCLNITGCTRASLQGINRLLQHVAAGLHEFYMPEVQHTKLTLTALRRTAELCADCHTLWLQVPECSDMAEVVSASMPCQSVRRMYVNVVRIQRVVYPRELDEPFRQQLRANGFAGVQSCQPSEDERSWHSEELLGIKPATFNNVGRHARLQNVQTVNQ